MINSTKDQDLHDDDAELRELLSQSEELPVISRRDCFPSDQPLAFTAQRNDFTGNPIQWSTTNGTDFIPTGTTADKLTPGYYEINYSDSVGYYFKKIPVKTDGLLRFPDGVTDRVVGEIQTFWDREEIFKKYNLAQKRGIILYGEQGHGKSSILQLICRDVIDRGGIVIKFINPSYFIEGYRKFRTIQKETKCVVIMEDIDSTLQEYSETSVLNILDGVEKIDKICFLATTNYITQLGGRIVNRPSRFDARFKVKSLNFESRKIYFEYLIGPHNPDINLKKWCIDTEGLSIAHLKELFVAVVILGKEYDSALITIKSMCKKISSDNDDIRIGLRGD